MCNLSSSRLFSALSVGAGFLCKERNLALYSSIMGTGVL